MGEFEFKRNCRSFPGNYACDIMTAEGYMSCRGCKFYEPISKRILIIKLGAMGDVIRTTPLLECLKKKYGDEIQITWLVNKERADFVGFWELIKDAKEAESYFDKIRKVTSSDVKRVVKKYFDGNYTEILIEQKN